jgi:hypothetical protein
MENGLGVEEGAALGGLEGMVGGGEADELRAQEGEEVSQGVGRGRGKVEDENDL